MGCCCECCICCFRACSPKSVAITGIILSAISFGFLIWGVADMVWPVSSGAKPTYIIGFVAMLLLLLGFIGILIIILVKNPQNRESLNCVGKIITIVLQVLCYISMITLIIAEIILIAKYADSENFLGGNFNLPTRWWITALVPGIISILLNTVLLKCTCALYTIFNKGIETSIEEGQNSQHTNKINTNGQGITLTIPDNTNITINQIPNTNQNIPYNLNQKQNQTESNNNPIEKPPQ